MGQCQHPKGLWRKVSRRMLFSTSLLLLLMLSSAAIGAQQVGRRRNRHDRAQDPASAGPRYFDAGIEPSAIHGKTRTPLQNDFWNHRIHKSTLDPAPALPRFLDDMIQPSAVGEKTRIPEEDGFWNRRVRKSMRGDRFELNAGLPREPYISRTAKQLSLPHRALGGASSIGAAVQNFQSESLSATHRRRLESSPKSQIYHSGQFGPPHLYRDRISERRRHFYRNPDRRSSYFHESPNSGHRASTSFVSREWALNNVHSENAALSSKVPSQSFVGNFYNDLDIIRRRTDEAYDNHVVPSSHGLKNSNDLSSHRLKNPNGPSSRLKENSFNNAGRTAGGKTATVDGRHSELRAAGAIDEDLPRLAAELDVIHFRGRKLLSADASWYDGEPGPRNRSPRSANNTRAAAQEGGNASSNCSTGHQDPGVHLVTIRWDVVGVYFTITAFVMFAGLGKLGFHQMHWVSRYIPESCLLIVLGVLMGLLVFFTNLDSSGACGNVAFPTFNSDSFFFVLLPPIILESAYSLHDRSFIDNLGSVLVFAIFGTLLNVFIIGPSLFGLAKAGAMGDFSLTLAESLVFSSLISAVDPVAVLSIFQELGVHKGLYFLVFGESLLNDGVTVVVYNMVSVFMEMPEVKVKDYVLSVVAFFVVTLCGATIGVIFGIFTALVTRATTNVRVVEPLALLGFAYLAYLGAELFHFSGIISLIVCGLVQAQYAFQNISDKSYTCVKYFTKMASATSETIIFMFLGMVLVSKDHVWHTGFVLWTLLLCFVVRVIVTLLLSAMVNHYRVRRIGMSEQLILAYGGLRGAVAFSLVSMLPSTMLLKEHFVTATLVVILFTVFIQGITMAPLVKWLDVAKSRSGPRILFEEVHVSVVDHMMAGIEEVLGEHGDFYLREQLRVYNEKYLKRWFVRPTCEAPLKRLFEKIAITEHYAHLYGPAELIQQHDLDVYSSKSKLVEDQASNGSSNRASVQILTTESAEGGQVEQLKLEQAPTKAELKRRKSSVASIMTGWGEGGRRGSAMSSVRDLSARQLEEDARVLRRAISSNPYNQLPYKHNRNLVNDDNQELQSHLQRRHTTARRLTRLASRSSQRHRNAPETETPLPPLSTPSMHHQNYWFSDDSTKSRSSKGPPTSGSQDLEDRKSPVPEDVVKLRSHPDARPPRESSWNRQPHLLPRPRPGRMVSLPGEFNPLAEDELATLPGADELIQQAQAVEILLDSARRRSVWRRAMLQRRRNRTLSDGDKSARNSVYSDALPPPAAGGGISTVDTVPEEPRDEDGGKSSTDHIAININSSGLANLGKLVADLSKATDKDSAHTPDPLSGYSSDSSPTGYSTDSTLPLAAPLLRPAFKPIPEHQATVDDPLLTGSSPRRCDDVTSAKKC